MNDKKEIRAKSSYATTWRIGRLWRRSPIGDYRRSLLQILALAHQPQTANEALSLPTLLSLYAQEESWRYRPLVRQLINRLESGLSLADAIEQTPELLSDEEILTIRLASQSGRLAESLDQMHRRYGDRSAEPNFGENMWPYYLSLGLVLCLIIAFVKALILPTFSFMFEEFGLTETLSFRWLHSSWADLAVMIFPVLIATILLCGWLSRRMGFTRRFRRAIGSFVSSRQHRLSQAKTLQLLADGMQGGRPMVGILATLARFHFDSRVRTQLLFAKNEIDLGSSLSDSFSQVGLLSASEAAAIGQLETHADRGWLLGKIAQRSIAQVQHERRLQATFIHPLIIGLFGLATMLVCVAVLSMLIKLITSLS